MNDKPLNHPSLKGYTLRKDGNYHRDRRVKVVLPAKSVEAIMARCGCSQAEAEEKLLDAMLRNSSIETLGLGVDGEGSVDVFEARHEQEQIEAPLVVL